MRIAFGLKWAPRQPIPLSAYALSGQRPSSTRRSGFPTVTLHVFTLAALALSLRDRKYSCQETWGVEMNCLNADRQGVRFPEHWRTAIPSARLCGLALQSAVDLQSSVGVVSLSCTMLGVPKCAPVPLAGAACVPGAVVQLQARNLARQDFLLAAHIDGDRLSMQDFLRGA